MKSALSLQNNAGREAEFDIASDISWYSLSPKPVAAAKMHLLNLDPIRDQLGSRWPRLSSLVHKLFENALREAQGPNDRFFATGELSYLVTFEGLSAEAATLACANVAKTVCELLFGADHGEMRVRSLVGLVPRALAEVPAGQTDELSLMLERIGTETITSSHAAMPEAVYGPETLDWACPPQGGWLPFLRQRGLRRGLIPVFVPQWELSRGLSQSLVAGLANAKGEAVQLPRLIPEQDADELAELEIAMLLAAAEFAQKLQQAGKVCALTAGVSYRTFGSRRLRLRYLKSLKTVTRPSSCPLLVRLEHIPAGIVLGRLAELVTILASTGVRVVLHFEDLVSLPRPGFRLGIVGLGADITRKYPPHALQRLVQQAGEQKAFSFLSGLDPSSRKVALEAGVRFGSGAGLDKTSLSGWEEAPDLPLKAKWCKKD